MLTEKDYAKIKSTAWSLCSSSWSCVACPRDTDKDESMCHTRRQLKDLYIEGMQAGEQSMVDTINANKQELLEELIEIFEAESADGYVLLDTVIDVLKEKLEGEL